jgi:hypothetical protein
VKHMALLIPVQQLLDYDNAERRRHPAIYREVPSSGQNVSLLTNQIFRDQLVSSSQKSRYLELEQGLNVLRDELVNLRHLGPDWDSYGAPAPNAAAFAAADAALRTLRLMNVLPTRILPSADGGVGMLFTEGEQYAHIEFENSGDTWVLMRGPDSIPNTWKLRSADADALREAWERISAGLQS